MKRLSLSETYRVAQWLESHLDECKRDSARESAEKVKADLGMEVHPTSLVRIARELGLPLFTRAQRRQKDFRQDRPFDVAAVLAKSIKELADALGHSLAHHDVLTDIVSRRVRPEGIFDPEKGGEKS